MKFFQSHKCNDYCRQLMLSDKEKFIGDKLLDHIIGKREFVKESKFLYDKFDNIIKNWQNNIKKFDESKEPSISKMTVDDIPEKEFEASSITSLNMSRPDLVK